MEETKQEKKKAKLRLIDATVLRTFETLPTGDWPTVEGDVRPAMPREVSKADLEIAMAKPEDRDMAKAKFYARHIVAWDVEMREGEIAPITPESILSLPHPVWNQFGDIVAGYSGAKIAGN
jgi:hypothetical protein